MMSILGRRFDGRKAEQQGFARDKGDFMFGPDGISFAKFFRDIEILRQNAIAAAAAAAKPTYTASKGQTPQVIAKALGHTDGGQAIAKANKLRVDQVIEPGVVLVIPKIEPIADPAETNFKNVVATKKDVPPPVDPKLLAADVKGGKTIEQIAAERKLKTADVTSGLETAGLQIKTTDPTSNNGDVKTTEIIDKATSKVVATHYEDLQHGGTTSKITDADGKEVTQSQYGDGTSSRTVNDTKKGETTTRVEDPKTGKVTETVVNNEKRVKETTTEKVGNETRKTEKLSFNGYTLTTAPDGTATLVREADGIQIAIKPNTPEASLAKTLFDVNPNSTDPEKAKEGAVVKTSIDAMLLGQNYQELDAAAQARAKDTKAAIDKYGAGQSTTPAQPLAPSGKPWVQVGELWVDPEVAKAMAAENTAGAKLIETSAKIKQADDQLNIYALDPAYKSAMNGAAKILDKSLAPHKLSWVRPEGTGTLDEARQQLAATDKQVTTASTTAKEYAEAERLTGEAITKKGQLPPPVRKDATVATSPSSHYDPETATIEWNAKNAEVNDLFAKANTHTANGDKAFADYLVGMRQENFAATKPGTKENTEAKQLLDQALSQQDKAGKNVEAAGVYENYHNANKTAADLQVKGQGIKQQIIAEDRRKNPDRYDWSIENKTYGGDYLGKITDQKVVEDPKNNQLYVETTYEHGGTKRIQLTFARSDKNVRGEFKDRELNKQWQSLVDGPEGQCGLGGLRSAQSAVISGGEQIKKLQVNDLDLQIKDLDKAIPELRKARDDAIAKYGPGTPDAPAGDKTNGSNVVDAGYTTPLGKGTENAPANGESVRIQIDGQWMWVHPEVANAQLALDTATNQKQSAERARDEANAARNRLNFALTQPIKLMVDEGSDTYGKNTEYAYLEKHRDEAIAEYQLKFNDLYKDGYTNDFKGIKTGKDLDTTVAKALGLNASQDAETLGKITGEIHDIAGDNVQYKIVPMFHVSEDQGSQQTALVAVKEGGGKVYYVDVTGKRFENLKDFQDNNTQFGEGGRLVVPRSLDMRKGPDSTIPLEVVSARNFTVAEKIIDPVVGTITTVATVASFIPPFAPVAAPIAMTGGAYLGGRAIARQVNHLQHGGEWGDSESWMNMGSVASSFIPMAAGGLRTLGMFRAVEDMSALQAARGSIGALRADSPMALKAAEYMSNGGKLNRTARGLDWSSLSIGIPMVGVSVHDIASGNLKGLDLFNTITGVATGAVGTAFGIRGLLMTRPNKGESEEGGASNQPFIPPVLPELKTNKFNSQGFDDAQVVNNVKNFVDFAQSKQPRNLSAAGREKDWGELWSDYQRHLGKDPNAGSRPEPFDIPGLANPLHAGADPNKGIGPITYNKPEITANTTPEQIGSMLPGQLARLEPREFENFTPVQAESVRKAARESLSDEQLAALETARKRRNPSTSGPKQTVQTVVASSESAPVGVTNVAAPDGPSKPVITLTTKPKEIKKLSDEEIALLSPEDLQALRRKQAKAVNPDKLETDEHLSALLYAQRRRGANEKRHELLDVMSERSPPKLRTGWIKGGVAGANIGAEALKRSLGISEVSNTLGGPSSAVFLSIRSNVSKYAWWSNNHGVQRAFGYAMVGNEKRAVERAEQLLARAGTKGAAKPSAEQKEFLIATLKEVASLGKAYRDARNGVSKADQPILPKIDTDKLKHPSISEEKTLNAMNKRVNYKVDKSVDPNDVATAQQRIEDLGALDPDKFGPAYDRYSRTEDARKAYDDLHSYLLDKFGHEQDEFKGTIDWKRAEKLVGSSMSPETHLGFALKAGALAAPANALAAIMLSSHSSHLNIAQWLAQDTGNVLRALPAVLIQTAYLKAVQNAADIKMDKSPMTPEKQANIKQLDQKKDDMNKASDETAWKFSLPGFALLGGVAASMPEGGLKSALYGAQAIGGLAWYAAQRPPKWMPTLPGRVNEGMRFFGIATSVAVPFYILIDSFFAESKDKSNDKSNLDKLVELSTWVFSDKQPLAPGPATKSTLPPRPTTIIPPATVPVITPTVRAGLKPINFNMPTGTGSVEDELSFHLQRAKVMLDPAYAGTKERAQYEAAGPSSSVFAWENMRNSAADMVKLLDVDARRMDIPLSA